MTCRRLAPDVIDVARGVTLEPARRDAVTAHLRVCASCAMLAERQRMMSVALRRLANEAEPEPVNDIRLGRLLARFDAPRPHLRRAAIGVGLSLAASLLIAAGLYVGRKNDAPARSASGVAATPAPSTNAAALDVAQASPERSRGVDFVVLPGASALPHFEHGEVIRVEVPSAGGAVQVDVLVGQDGLARAARLVSN